MLSQTVNNQFRVWNSCCVSQDAAENRVSCFSVNRQLASRFYAREHALLWISYYVLFRIIMIMNTPTGFYDDNDECLSANVILVAAAVDSKVEGLARPKARTDSCNKKKLECEEMVNLFDCLTWYAVKMYSYLSAGRTVENEILLTLVKLRQNPCLKDVIWMFHLPQIFVRDAIMKILWYKGSIGLAGYYSVIGLMIVSAEQWRPVTIIGCWM